MCRHLVCSIITKCCNENATVYFEFRPCQDLTSFFALKYLTQKVALTRSQSKHTCVSKMVGLNPEKYFFQGSSMAKTRQHIKKISSGNSVGTLSQ